MHCVISMNTYTLSGRPMTITWKPSPCTASLEWKRTLTRSPEATTGTGSCFPHNFSPPTHCRGPWGSLPERSECST